MEEGSNTEEILPATGVLADLSEDVRRQLTEAGEFETLPEGRYLHIQGELPDSMYFIVAGEVGVKSHANAETVELATLGAGVTVGEMGVIDPRPASANVRTSTETRVWRISHKDLEAFLEADHSNGYAVMRALAKVLCQRIRCDTERSLRDAHRQHDASYDADY